MAAFTVIIRRRGKVEKVQHDTLAAALDALETETRAAATTQVPRVERALGREYEPSEQVAVRGEVRGPGGAAGGIDVRGDGSAEAFTGRFRRRLVDARDGEDAWAALRRVVAS
jgi:hypothetical protein